METGTYAFRTEFIHNREIQKEFLGASLHVNSFVKYLHIFLIGILLWFFYEMIFVLDAPTEFSGGMISITVLYLIIEGIRFLTNLGGGIHYKRTLETNGGKPVRCAVQFYENHILSLNLDTGSKSTLTYDQVKAIFETKNLILLSMKYRIFLIVDKRALTGNQQTFCSFLLEHCTKIKRKKVHSIRSGQIINRIKWIVIFLLLFFAILVHPAVQIKERLMGQIHNGMEVSEILSELENFGITCSDPENAQIMYGSTTFFDGSRLESILHYIGVGEYNYETNMRIPSENGVYFLYLWADNPDTMYTDLLEGISALDRDTLAIGNIQESVSNEDCITVTFDLNGSSHTLKAERINNHYDIQFLNALNEIIQTETGKALYFADYEGFGYFLFFRDVHWAESFSRRTGLDLTPQLLTAH